MRIERTTQATLTAVEMLHGDTLIFGLLDGSTVEIELVETGAEIMHTTVYAGPRARKRALPV